MLRFEFTSPSLATCAAISLVTSALASALAYLLNVTLDLPVYFLTFFPSILASSWLGGRRSGILSTLLSLPTVFYFLPPREQWTIHHTPGTWTALLLFVAMAAVLVEFTTRVRTSLVIRDVLLSITGHDIKQPLSTIALETQHLRRLSERGTVSPDEVGIHATRIARQSDELGLMFMNLLDMVRVGSARILHPESVDISEIIRGVVERFSATLTSRGYDVTIEGADRPVPGVWDRMALDRILANLISNAAKYGDGKPIAITLTASPTLASVVVQDHGRGMSPEDRRHCFEPFRRGSARAAAKGHGLGLWIVKMLVDAHRGTIAVDSAGERGTAFRIDLPRVPAKRRFAALSDAYELLKGTKHP